MQQPSTRDAIPGLGSYLRSIREEKGLSQTALAKIAKTAVATVSKLENDARFPSLRLARDIAEALGVSLDALARPPKRFLKKVGE